MGRAEQGMEDEEGVRRSARRSAPREEGKGEIHVLQHYYSTTTVLQLDWSSLRTHVAVDTAVSGCVEPQCPQHHPHVQEVSPLAGGCMLLSTHSALSCGSVIIDCCSPMTREEPQEQA